MKDKLTVQELRTAFIENGQITETATRKGDYRTNNKAYNELIKIFKIFEKDINLAKKTLEPLLDPIQTKNLNLHTKLIAATHALALNIYKEQALTILEEIASQKCFYSFMAETLIDQWEKGELAIYKK